MTAKQKLHQASLNEWAARFADHKASGLTTRQWCEQNNLSIHKYNYWKHLLKEEVTDKLLPDIAPLTLPTPLTSADNLHATFTNPMVEDSDLCPFSSGYKVSINGIHFEFTSPISDDLLKAIIKAVRHA